MLLLRSRKKKRRSNRLRTLIILAALALALFVGRTAFEVGMPRYKTWKQNRALGQARDYLAKHDAANAKLSLDIALLTSPGSPDAWRVAADLLEQVGAAQSLRLRRQVVQLAPDSMPDRAALVSTALRFRDLPSARDALSDLTTEQANRPEALQAALAYALATNAEPVADALYDRLRALRPGDPGLQLAHATLHLRHPDPAKADAARAAITALADQPAHAAQACRTLLAEALVKQDYAAARTWAERLVGLPGATLADELHLANLRLLVANEPLAKVLPPLKTRASADAAQAAELARWLVAQRKAPEALKYLLELPAELHASPEIADFRAQLRLQRGDWETLGTELAAGAWGAVPPETLRLALASRLLEDRKRTALRRQIWNEAVDSSTQSLVGLRMLTRLAGQWDWDEESERALWAISKGFPEESWAPLALFYAYREKDDASHMRELSLLLSQRNPGLGRFQHDWALLDLLTNPTAQWNRAKDVLKQLHSVSPQNPYFATSHAFALFQAGQTREALALVEALPETDRLLPTRAPYLAAIYAGARRKEAATRYLAVAETVPLLAEERALLAQARNTLRAAPGSQKPANAPTAPPASAPTSAPTPEPTASAAPANSTAP